MSIPKHVIIIGAGPAGLTAAYLLCKKGVPVTVLESDPVYVGGLSKTVQYKGFYFDIGGHRFFSKSKEVEDFWTEILGDDLLIRNRKSRIFYNGKFYTYPLKAIEALRNLGLFTSTLCVLSYIKARIFPVKNPKNFEDWVSNRFGKKLFSIFFKTYTEKVWGMSCKEISADWAAQRIKKLSLWEAIKNAVFTSENSKKNSGEIITTLIDSFRYPRKGPGMMWETTARKIQEMGGHLIMGAQILAIEHNHVTNWKINYQVNSENLSIESNHVISSAAIKDILGLFKPELNTALLSAANKLTYRDFIVVTLMLKDNHLLDDNWIYIHSPTVKVGRVQNFKAWSPEMVPDSSMMCLGLEYFCFEGDNLWELTDNALLELGKKELCLLGLARNEDIMDGCVVRQKKAYPVYDEQYAQNVTIVKEELQSNFPTFHLVGRNGMHKYNNQDHAMVTAMLTVENIFQNKNAFNVWEVNEDALYIEDGNRGSESEKAGTGLRMTPKRI
ncbi:MAG: FAD-dependent oxidoreductase [Bacteroidetes bacterium RIFCSPLOWO2_12_FULL_37_12]|nr:MAG: FAD-dependent oxidoreductase [Bacteroidetes bacterium RIFCSPLOWO2_12_FULL_37_12]